MKFLVIGDFHGKMPKDIMGIVKNEDIDLILSTGDYCGDERVAKLFFKYVYDKKKDDVPKEILKRIEKYERDGVEAGFEVLKKLRKLNVPFLGVRGNWDPIDYPYDIGSEVREKDNKNSKKIEILQREDFRFIDFSLVDCKDFLIVGGASSTHPGKIDKKTLRKIEAEDGKKEAKMRMKNYKKRERIYKKVFLKANKLKKPIIFLTHNCPYNTKLDKIKKGTEKGKHYGSFLEKEMVRRFKPELVLCGHMHENQGKDKIGKSLIVNVGAFMKKQYAIIDWDEKQGNVREVKLIK